MVLGRLTYGARRQVSHRNESPAAQDHKTPSPNPIQTMCCSMTQCTGHHDEGANLHKLHFPVEKFIVLCNEVYQIPLNCQIHLQSQTASNRHLFPIRIHPRRRLRSQRAWLDHQRDRIPPKMHNHAHHTLGDQNLQVHSHTLTALMYARCTHWKTMELRSCPIWTNCPLFPKHPPL